MINVVVSNEMRNDKLYVTVEIGPLLTTEDAKKIVESLRQAFQPAQPPPTLGISVGETVAAEDKVSS